jgi:hypothetical protein
VVDDRNAEGRGGDCELVGGVRGRLRIDRWTRVGEVCGGSERVQITTEVVGGERSRIASVLGKDGEPAGGTRGKPVTHLADGGVSRQSTEALVNDVPRR